MAHRSIEILIGRLVTNELFRAAFLGNPTATLTGFMDSGYELTSVEIAALRATSFDLWEQVAERIDPRLQQASLMPTQEEL